MGSLSGDFTRIHLRVQRPVKNSEYSMVWEVEGNTAAGLLPVGFCCRIASSRRKHYLRLAMLARHSPNCSEANKKRIGKDIIDKGLTTF